MANGEIPRRSSFGGIPRSNRRRAILAIVSGSATSTRPTAPAILSAECGTLGEFLDRLAEAIAARMVAELRAQARGGRPDAEPAP